MTPEEAQAQAIQEAVNQLTLPERRQLEAVLREDKVYWEVPVDIITFIEHPDYLDRKGEFFPSVLHDLRLIFDAKGEDNADGAFAYNEAALLKAIGSGKSYGTGAMATYLTYRLLCFTNYHKRMGLADSTKSAFVVMAPTGRLAKEILFSYVSQFVYKSPWFRKYYPPDPNIKSILRFDPQPEDKEGNALDTKGKYYKNLAIIPGNSSENSALGWSLYGAAIDEANFWETYENLKNGNNETVEKIYTALQRRIRSRFKNWGVLALISSSEQEDDFIEKKIIESEDDKDIYAIRLAIWEAKPAGYYSAETFEVKAQLHGKDVLIYPPIDLKKDFKKNELKSLRDHASIPAGSENNFFNPATVEKMAKAVDNILPSPVAECDYMGYIEKWAEHMKTPVPYICVFSGDLSKSRDSCGLAMSYWDPYRNRMVTPFLWEIQASHQRPLDYEAVRQIIRDLRGFGWNIHVATFDNYQSTDMMQQLEAEGIATEKISVDANTIPYDTLSDYLLTNSLAWFPHPTCVRELKKLVIILGKKIDHPKAGTKDTADALAANAFIIGRDIRAMTSIGADPGDKYSSTSTGDSSIRY